VSVGGADDPHAAPDARTAPRATRGKSRTATVRMTTSTSRSALCHAEWLGVRCSGNRWDYPRATGYRPVRSSSSVVICLLSAAGTQTDVPDLSRPPTHAGPAGSRTLRTRRERTLVLLGLAERDPNENPETRVA
jgi:hypothetical protein